MKKYFLILFLFIAGLSFGQRLISNRKFPTKENYLMLGVVADTSLGNIVFSDSRKVYFNYNRKTKNADSYFIGSRIVVADIFKFAKEINLASIKSLDEKSVKSTTDFSNHYNVIEYKNAGKVVRICWDENATDVDSVNLNKLRDMMANLW